MFMDDSVLECSQMESFNWPVAPTGLVIRNGLWWQRAQIYGSQCEFCLRDPVPFLENNSHVGQNVDDLAQINILM